MKFGGEMLACWVLAIAAAEGLVFGVPSSEQRRRRAMPVLMRAVPGTLQFSAFKGYSAVTTDEGSNVLSPQLPRPCPAAYRLQHQTASLESQCPLL